MRKDDGGVVGVEAQQCRRTDRGVDLARPWARQRCSQSLLAFVAVSSPSAMEEDAARSGAGGRKVDAMMLRDLGVRTMKLMTNNPSKYVGPKGYGLAIAGRIPLVTPIIKENKRYLETKRSKMGHIYGAEINGRFCNLISKNGKPSSTFSSDPAVSASWEPLDSSTANDLFRGYKQIH